ncbi:MAG: PIN domain nuclease [Acidobacteria bacterium]|nr:PIN domain nuclease [Acidobacteriota bacterium]MBU1339932.1 PIN domain nuclease [Acidobacteriota bacterium]MBU1475225.1 PIN domain nuclease [Acidobacteriota bacterium]MBU2438651.1 PIN domain nuclease [Acidobacteriota bacterium]
MKVIVDTCIWSLALRKAPSEAQKDVEELQNLILDRRVQMLGPIRQELLSGIRNEPQFQRVKTHLAAFDDFPLISEDYERAAMFFNLCRAKGIQGSNTDFLILNVSLYHPTQ